METILLRRIEVEQMVGLSRSTIYRLMRLEKFPLPLKIGPRARRWLKSELLEWLSTRPRATGDADDTSDNAGRGKKKRNSAAY